MDHIRQTKLKGRVGTVFCLFSHSRQSWKNSQSHIRNAPLSSGTQRKLVTLTALSEYFQWLWREVPSQQKEERELAIPAYAEKLLFLQLRTLFASTTLLQVLTEIKDTDRKCHHCKLVDAKRWFYTISCLIPYQALSPYCHIVNPFSKCQGLSSSYFFHIIFHLSTNWRCSGV